MKIGTFVKSNGVDLNAEEIAALSKEITDNVKTYLDGVIPYKVSMKVDKSYDNADILTCKVNIMDNRVKRDAYGNCYKPFYISIDIRKGEGYDESVHGAYYTWKDGFKPNNDIQSYTMTINIIGDFRGYHKRIIERRVGLIATNYQYGTELNDLNISEGFKKIGNYLKESKSIKIEF